MKILNINKNKWKDDYTLELDNGETYIISLEQIVKYKLKEGKEIEYDNLKEILYEENEKQAFNKALDIISLRDNTSFEIKSKLSIKGYDSEVIEKVLQKLLDYNFINDEKYANNYLANAIKNKKYGKNKVISILKQKGISSNILSKLDFDENNELETARLLCEKKLRTLKEDDKKKEKIYRFLLSRGYTHSIALKIIQSL
ncbi:regulatory protein RecX [Clostridium cylindrosporum]|uniref:Regulatory protein RecX n=1 Tax=Clostridium cylindrosporum DSM 605 TaxID=1121307 RepID=A0A0J8DB38_CLOCY|nr:regulatory protein RecX [Clostridium cylindrosporum]KMT23047.1 hypothetical protein CLCY_7c00940 [Clostridium cylindrosporum DSM 605]